MLAITLLLFVLPAGEQTDYYTIETIPTPEGVVMEAGAARLIPAGEGRPQRLAVSTRRGEVWMLSDPLGDAAAGAHSKPQWTRFAHGLHEVLGLAWKDGWLYVTQRPDVSRVRDEDGDGRADIYEVVADGWGISGDYHEYAFSTDFLPPESDYAGEIWVSLCLTGSFGSKVPFRGWAVRVTPDGRTVPVVSGVRSPGGMDFNAAGDVFYSDNQGPWNGTCGIKHLRPGAFVGHPGGFRWYEDTDAAGERPEEPKSESRIIVEADRIPKLEPAAVLLPYDRMGKSTSGILFDRTQPTLGNASKFGPWTMPDGGPQAYVADQAHSTVMRMTLERVQGHYQGACYPMLEGFESGNLALEQAADGTLFVGGTNRGWGSRGKQPFAWERVRWTGKTPPAINFVSATPDGFDVQYTLPVGESSIDRAAYDLEAFTYIYQEAYGSPEVDAWTPEITRVERLDGRTVRLHFARLERGFVYKIAASGVRGDGGDPGDGSDRGDGGSDGGDRGDGGVPLWQPIAYYTMNYVPERE